jgi:putative heme-binding domain-containing protein
MRKFIRALFVLAMSSAGLLSSGVAQQDPIAALTPVDLDQGERIYKAQCALCHGIDGGGGTGPTLQKPVLSRAADNDALYSVIRSGVPGKMPGGWLSEGETWQVAGYVRSLGKVESGDLPGDAARGRRIYAGEGGCAGCHIVDGEGGSLGPDLTTIGEVRGARHLRESLVDPGAALPDGQLLITAIARDGERIAGLRVNEDVSTIQLRDGANRFHSLRKADLSELRREFGKSLMPSYERSLTDAELDDLVAYLASLRRKP